MWPKDVIVRIEGGLGNQIFQYAAARSLADRLGCGLRMDIRSIHVNGDRPFQLDLYKVRAEVLDADQERALPDARSSRMGRWKSRLSQRFPSEFSFPVFWPETFAFDVRFDKIKRPPYLVGYWQSEKYFRWNRNALLNDLQLVTQSGEGADYQRQMQVTTSVALHIRRGDYVNNTNAARVHGTCDLSYYARAVESLGREEPDIHLFVFSDDLEWCRRSLHYDFPITFVDNTGPDSAQIDLVLMQHCKHHIVANSSFSWWGAWLAEWEGQRVYAPAQWFLDPQLNASDVVPQRWTRI